MINLKKIMAGALIIATTFSTVGCGKTIMDPNVVAKISNEVVTIDELNKILKYDIDWLTEEYGEDFENTMDEDMKATWASAKEAALNQIIEEKILLKKADSLGVTFTDEELAQKVQEKYDSYLTLYGGQEGLDAQMKSYGYTDEYFRELIKTEIICQTVVDNIIKDVSVTEEDAKKYYDENQAEFTVGKGVTVKHILYPTEEAAKNGKADIDANNNFDALFDSFKDNQYAEGVTIAEDLGFVEYDSEMYDKDFLAGIKNLKAGEISVPIKTQFGYHVVKAISLTEAESVTPFDEIKNSLLEKLQYEKEYEKYNKTIEEWKKELNVSIYNE